MKIEVFVRRCLTYDLIAILHFENWFYRIKHIHNTIILYYITWTFIFKIFFAIELYELVIIFVYPDLNLFILSLNVCVII